MSDVQADATAREFEAADRSETTTEHYNPKPVDHEFSIAVCPCCAAKVRVMTERSSETEAPTVLEFVSYNS